MPRYQFNSTRPTNKGNIFSLTIYSDIPLSQEDIYVITTSGDRYDTLALQYYQKSNMWWVISIANPQYPKDTLTPPLGVQIRIPEISNAFQIANQYGNY